MEYVLSDQFKDFNRVSYIKLIKMSLLRKHTDNAMGDAYIITDDSKIKLNFLPLSEAPKNQLIKRIQGY